MTLIAKGDAWVRVRSASGTTLYGQFWYRDPPTASTTGLSDAVCFTLCN